MHSINTLLNELRLSMQLIENSLRDKEKLVISKACFVNNLDLIDRHIEDMKLLREKAKKIKVNENNHEKLKQLYKKKAFLEEELNQIKKHIAIYEK